MMIGTIKKKVALALTALGVTGTATFSVLLATQKSNNDILSKNEYLTEIYKALDSFRFENVLSQAQIDEIVNEVLTHRDFDRNDTNDAADVEIIEDAADWENQMSQDEFMLWVQQNIEEANKANAAERESLRTSLVAIIDTRMQLATANAIEKAKQFDDAQNTTLSQNLLNLVTMQISRLEERLEDKLDEFDAGIVGEHDLNYYNDMLIKLQTVVNDETGTGSQINILLNDVDLLQRTVEGIKSDVNSLYTSTSSNEITGADLKTSVTTLATSLDTLEAEVDTNTTNLKTLQADLAAKLIAMAENIRDNSTFSAEIKANIDSVVQTAATDKAALDASIAGMLALIKTNGTLIDANGDAINSFETVVDNLVANLAANGVSINTLEEKLKKTDALANSLNDKVIEYKDVQDELVSKTEAILNIAQASEATGAVNAADITALTNSLNAYKTQTDATINSNTSTINTLNTTTRETRVRLEALETKVTNIQTEVDKLTLLYAGISTGVPQNVFDATIATIQLAVDSNTTLIAENKANVAKALQLDGMLQWLLNEHEAVKLMVNENRDKIKDLEKDMKTVIGNVATVMQTTSDLSIRIDAVDAKILGMETRLQALENAKKIPEYDHGKRVIFASTDYTDHTNSVTMVSLTQDWWKYEKIEYVFAYYATEWRFLSGVFVIPDSARPTGNNYNNVKNGSLKDIGYIVAQGGYEVSVNAKNNEFGWSWIQYPNWGRVVEVHGYLLADQR